MSPEPSSAWVDDIGVTAASLLLSLLDGDHERARNLLESCTFSELAQLSIDYAQGLISCCAPEDRPGLRATVEGLLKGLDSMAQWPDGPGDPRTE